LLPSVKTTKITWSRTMALPTPRETSTRFLCREVRRPKARRNEEEI
jgi:hypothetical protein